MGIPVALSTDDRGMWDSTMTDEFFVAVHEFNLSWEEIKLLSRNSLEFSFVNEKIRHEMLQGYDKRIAAFERQMLRGGMGKIQNEKITCRGFIQKQYALCDPN
jgi:adenosine deaminase CECR1